MSKVARTPVRTERAPLPPPFLSQGLVVGDVVYCSGQVGADPTTGKLVEGSIQNRTRQILRNLNAVLEAGGSSLHDAIKVNIFLTDMADFPAVNEVYATFFSDPKPVRTCVSVKSLPLGTDVEIECSGLVTSGNGRSSRL
ncbi:YjgF/Yer057p/UK114 family [Penicillium brevicompactum]|uniref:YjgF/Yer057p/UK114 family n=1 Tax=Penicillium brevicompactum TaxID=5074 RepID=A0A9W9QNU8_PENBR|nr:YjgF/Yer057p/UK114 family [Penicillium brevicompactum]KAJ5326488.1 YjgF/Yer057p/UK114 family [Penicillium brevicompactum]KAJ5338703.1 YjgF/Yer057p/UK114 family [Penicillium brevicompactum]KAJ5341547.1 YjgF/Yer057p/UK114 family [Penicillium brevicompactum]